MTLPSSTSKAANNVGCRGALEVVGHRSNAALLHRQARLGAVKRLDLRFLIDRENNRMSGWIDLEPDNVTQRVDELWVVGELELSYPMRLKAVSAPKNDGLYRRGATLR